MQVIAVVYTASINEHALDTFNTAVVSPIYYVMFTTLTILASIIMFKEWNGQSRSKIASEICGFIIVLSGKFLLHLTKDYDKSPSINMYTTLSPSLSAHFSRGSGEFNQCVDEQGLFSEDHPFQKHEP